MYYSVWWMILRFDIKDFALVSGLNCVGDQFMANNLEWNGKLLSKYFENDKTLNKVSMEHEIKLHSSLV